MNAAWPSLACHAAGSIPNRRSNRTPPTPSTHSCRSRISGPPAYSFSDRLRSCGSFTSRLVSNRRIGTEPTIIRQAPTCSVRSPMGMVAR